MTPTPTGASSPTSPARCPTSARSRSGTRQDEGNFWRGAPEPGAYAALLRAAYPQIKAADPNVTVVTGGMVGNNYEFLSDVYANGGGGSFDAVGVHTDTACLLTSPAEYYREPNGRVGRYSFTGYREVHDVMTANGDGGKRIWMTEIGWNTGSRKARLVPRRRRRGHARRGRDARRPRRGSSRSPTGAWRPTRTCRWRCGSRCRTSARAPATATTSG